MSKLSGFKLFKGEWLESIPKGWFQKKIRYLFKVKKIIAGELGHNIISITQQGAKIKDTESGKGQLSMDYSKYQLVQTEDFLMNHMDLLTGYVDIAKFNGVTSPDYRVFVLSDICSHSKYFLFVFQHCYKTKIFYGYGRGSSNLGRWRFPTVEFENFYLPVPPLQEQKLIARYLDKKTAQIDLLIEKIEKKIALLQEKRTALINQCVTKGLDPNVEMKDSGIEWIGEIPKHWDISKIKYLCNMFNGNSLNEKQKIQYQSDDKNWLPYISSKDIQIGTHKINYNNGLRLPRGKPNFKMAYKDSFLIVIEGGSTGRKLAYLSKDVYFVNKLCSIKAHSRTKYMYYFFQSEFIQNYFKMSISGLIGGVSITNISSFIVCNPPLQEQKLIAQHLNKQITKIDLLIEKIKKKTFLLQEKRQVLISSVVTGKVRVTEAML